jgi:two-component system LytT family response regulator
MLKSIVVDDEVKSGESLKILIEDFCDDVEVCAACKSVDEAIVAVRQCSPDVVFLDIQMQRETGFDLLEKLPEITFEVIFTTAHSEYAIKAFKFSAIDYLLKPIDLEELKASLAKVRKKIGQGITARLQQLMRNLRETSGENYKLALPTADGLFFVKVSSIVYCEASSNYTEIVTDDGRKHIVSRTLKEYDEMLSEYNFYRIHNSYLINLNAVKKYVRGEGGSVIMTTGQSLDVSKRKKEGFLARIAKREAAG